MKLSCASKDPNMYPATADIDIIDELDSATRLLEQALDRLEHWLTPQPKAPSGAAEQTGARDYTTTAAQRRTAPYGRMTEAGSASGSTGRAARSSC